MHSLVVAALAAVLGAPARAPAAESVDAGTWSLTSPSAAQLSSSSPSAAPPSSPASRPSLSSLMISARLSLGDGWTKPLPARRQLELYPGLRKLSLHPLPNLEIGIGDLGKSCFGGGPQLVLPHGVRLGPGVYVTKPVPGAPAAKQLMVVLEFRF